MHDRRNARSMSLSLGLAMAAAGVLLYGVVLVDRARAASGGDCDLGVSPGVVEVGQNFWVSGNFNNAAIHQVRGNNVALPTDNEAVAFAAPDQASFRFRFAAEPGEVGFWTIWAVSIDTVCSDSAVVEVVRELPDTATPLAVNPIAQTIGLILIALALVLHGLTPEMRRNTGEMSGLYAVQALRRLSDRLRERRGSTAG
jgi:hypothetical protein